MNFYKNQKYDRNIQCGFENISVKEIAKNVQKIIPSKIVTKKSNDPRSYRMNSDKLIKLVLKENLITLTQLKI